MDSWYEKLQGDDSRRDLCRAEHLTVDEMRAWLKAHYEGADPSISAHPDVDNARLFEDTWEQNPAQAVRRRLNEAILLEYRDRATAPEDNTDYLAFLLRLMIYLPLEDFPKRSVWRLYRSSRIAALRTGDGLTLDKLLIQALFAHKAVSLAEQRDLLKNRDAVNLAYKAIRDTGLGPAISHLSELLDTLNEPTDDVAILSHLRILISQHGQEVLISAIRSSSITQNQVQEGRLRRLLKKIGIDTETVPDATVLFARLQPRLSAIREWKEKVAAQSVYPFPRPMKSRTTASEAVI